MCALAWRRPGHASTRFRPNRVFMEERQQPWQSVAMRFRRCYGFHVWQPGTPKTSCVKPASGHYEITRTHM